MLKSKNQFIDEKSLWYGMVNTQLAYVEPAVWAFHKLITFASGLIDVMCWVQGTNKFMFLGCVLQLPISVDRDVSKLVTTLLDTKENILSPYPFMWDLKGEFNSHFVTTFIICCFLLRQFGRMWLWQSLLIFPDFWKFHECRHSKSIHFN